MKIKKIDIYVILIAFGVSLTVYFLAKWLFGLDILFAMLCVAGFVSIMSMRANRKKRNNSK